jgi:hypothetical protein
LRYGSGLRWITVQQAGGFAVKGSRNQNEEETFEFQPRRSQSGGHALRFKAASDLVKVDVAGVT